MRKAARWTTTLMIGALATLSGAAAQAQSKTPVVVELFTSQGCSSCPPADAYLGELARQEHVIALSMHVTYWDRLGWKDTFGDREFTDRQYDYRSSLGGVVYTPQFVIQGSQGMEPYRSVIASAVDGYAARPAEVTVEARQTGQKIEVTVTPQRDLGDVDADIWLVMFDPQLTQEIERGENRGRTITYHNVVRQVRRLGAWDGDAASLSIDVDPSVTGCAILVQRDDLGPILGAAKVTLAPQG